MVFGVPPSGKWLGNDGDWSTFTVLVGRPEQRMEVLPATLLQFTIVVSDRGCNQTDPINCSEDRGALFTMSEPSLYSTAWQGVVQADGNPVSQLVFEAARATLSESAYARMGTTSLGLKWRDTGVTEPPLENQLIAGLITKQPFIGCVGLSGWGKAPVNETVYPSPLEALRDRSKSSNTSTVTGLSWGYTAGAKYSDPPVFGSLTMGGYDASRVKMDTALCNVPLLIEAGKDLTVKISSIKFGSFASQPVDVMVVLDSMVPDIWLPDEICIMFENEFDLEWNAEHQMYLISDAKHESLRSQNMPVTFELTADSTSSQSTTIRLPYSAFDHVIKWPLANNTDGTSKSYYFPLRKSGNNSVYFLGRTFFQEAYVSADYERAEFNVGQALFDPSKAPSLVAIDSPDMFSEPQPEPKPDNTLGAAAIAGISVGGFVVLSILAALLWWRRRSRKRRDEAKQPPRMHRVLSADETTLAAADVEMTNMAEHRMTEHYKPVQELHGGPSDGAAEPYAKPELDSTATGMRYELGSARGTAHRPGHRRQQQSFGSSQSGISPMGVGDRGSGTFGEPSPPLNYSPRPSPPLPEGRPSYYPFELE